MTETALVRVSGDGPPLLRLVGVRLDGNYVVRSVPEGQRGLMTAAELERDYAADAADFAAVA
jgi:hypothetical protein